MENTAYDHKLTEYSQKKLSNNSSGAAYFCIKVGNHGFYNGAKDENFEIDFFTRIIYQYVLKAYKNKQNCHI